MKYGLFFVIVLSFPKWGTAQHIVIADTKPHVIYMGLSNALDVSVDGYKCADYELTTDNGQIEKSEPNCTYSIIPARLGFAIIKVNRKSTHKLIGTAKLWVKSIPDPVAMLSRKTGGTISKNVLQVQVGLSADILNFDIDAHIIITGFTIVILRNGQPVFVKECDSQIFPQDVKDAFASTEVNDKIIFSGILYRGAATQGPLHPIEFKVVP